MARAVDAAEQESAAALCRLRAGADDREVDRNHRQHARRQVQRQAAEKDEAEDRQRPSAFERPLRLDAALGVVDERQEIRRRLVPVGGAEDRELVEQGHIVRGARRTTSPPGRLSPPTRRTVPRLPAAPRHARRRCA